MNADTSKAGFHVCVFFAANPLAALSVTQVSQRLSITREHVQPALRYCVINRLLAIKASRRHRGGRHENVYSAGPELLAMIACKPDELPAEFRDSELGQLS